MSNERSSQVGEVVGGDAERGGGAVGAGGSGDGKVGAAGGRPVAPGESGETAAAVDAASVELQGRIVNAIRGVYDPEIPVNIYDLGLIYQVNANAETGRAAVLMTLTTPNCPEAQTLPGHVKNAVESVVGVKEADVQVIWDPPWTPDKMSDEARLELGMF